MKYRFVLIKELLLSLSNSPPIIIACKPFLTLQTKNFQAAFLPFGGVPMVVKWTAFLGFLVGARPFRSGKFSGTVSASPHGLFTGSVPDAERKAGAMLVDLLPNGRPEKVSSCATLSDLGITWGQSSKWQRLATVPEAARKIGLAYAL